MVNGISTINLQFWTRLANNLTLVVDNSTYFVGNKILIVDNMALPAHKTIHIVGDIALLMNNMNHIVHNTLHLVDNTLHIARNIRLIVKNFVALGANYFLALWQLVVKGGETAQRVLKQLFRFLIWKSRIKVWHHNELYPLVAVLFPHNAGQKSHLNTKSLIHPRYKWFFRCWNCRLFCCNHAPNL